MPYRNGTSPSTGISSETPRPQPFGKPFRARNVGAILPPALIRLGARLSDGAGSGADEREGTFHALTPYGERDRAVSIGPDIAGTAGLLSSRRHHPVDDALRAAVG